VTQIHVPKIREARFHQEGTRVVMLIDGRAVLDVDWQTADGIARALMAKARDAEEVAKHEQLSTDAAILLRSGAPFGFTSHPAIRAIAATKAAWDSALRRYLPGGVKGRTMFGRPGVIQSDHITEE
jgi:hypothetical protein